MSWVLLQHLWPGVEQLDQVLQIQNTLAIALSCFVLPKVDHCREIGAIPQDKSIAL